VHGLLRHFDVSILSFLNRYSRHSHAFDCLVTILASNQLTKGGIIVAFYWWVWFRRSNKSRDHEFLVFGLMASLVAIAVARGLSLLGPFRERPLRDPALHFVMPFGMSSEVLIHWSSFPSDHAAVFLALSYAIYLVARGPGLLALGYAFFAICLPRIYIGVHYPTDILAGILIGVGLASLAKIDRLRTTLTRPALNYLETSHESFHALLFLLTFQLAVTFDPIRTIARGLLEMMAYRP